MIIKLIFNSKCAVETKKDVNTDKLKPQVHKLFRKARLREFSVGFIVLTKQIEGSDFFKVVVECCHVDKMEEQKIVWMDDGYEDQTPQVSPFTIRSKQMLKLCLSKHFKGSHETEDAILQFHPKRRNWVSLAVEVASPAKRLVGHVQVLKFLSETERNIDDDQSKEAKTRVLTQLGVELLKDSVKYIEKLVEMETPSNMSPSRTPTLIKIRVPSSRGIDYNKEAKGDPSFRGKLLFASKIILLL